MKFIIGVYAIDRKLNPSTTIQQGDIVFCRPYTPDYIPPSRQSENHLHFVIDLDSREQAEALCEVYIDTTSKIIDDTKRIAGKPKYLLYPNNIKKRRFRISLGTLHSMVGDINAFKENTPYFNGLIPLDKLDIMDDLNSRNILATDGLNVFKPEIDNVSL